MVIICPLLEIGLTDLPIFGGSMAGTMAIRVVKFSSGGYKLERFLPKNQHTQRKLLNFENWVNGEVSKIGHHYSKYSDLKIDVIKKCQ